MTQVEETERPQFRSKDVFDPTTGQHKKVYGSSQRVLRYAISVPVLAGLIVLVLYFMLGIFSTRDDLLEHYVDEEQRRMTALEVFKSLFSGWSASLLTSGSSGVDSTSNDTSSGSESKDSSSDKINLNYARWEDPYFWLVTLFYPSLYGIILPIFASIFCRYDDVVYHMLQCDAHP